MHCINFRQMAPQRSPGAQLNATDGVDIRAHLQDKCHHIHQPRKRGDNPHESHESIDGGAEETNLCMPRKHEDNIPESVWCPRPLSSHPAATAQQGRHHERLSCPLTRTWLPQLLSNANPISYQGAWSAIDCCQEQFPTAEQKCHIVDGFTATNFRSKRATPPFHAKIAFLPSSFLTFCDKATEN